MLVTSSFAFSHNFFHSYISVVRQNALSSKKLALRKKEPQPPFLGSGMLSIELQGFSYFFGSSQLHFRLYYLCKVFKENKEIMAQSKDDCLGNGGKHNWKRRKTPVTSIFSFSHTVFESFPSDHSSISSFYTSEGAVICLSVIPLLL